MKGDKTDGFLFCFCFGSFVKAECVYAADDLVKNRGVFVRVILG